MSVMVYFAFLVLFSGVLSFFYYDSHFRNFFATIFVVGGSLLGVQLAHWVFDTAR